MRVVRRRTSLRLLLVKLQVISEGEIVHKFLRAVGFSMYQKRRDIDKLTQGLAKDRDKVRILQLDLEESLCEPRVRTAPGMGIAIVGELDGGDRFDVEYYYPYSVSRERSSIADCFTQCHTEKEAYAGLLDDHQVDISLVYCVKDMMEYRTRELAHESANVDYVSLSGLCVSGKVLLPIQKTWKQTEMAKVVSRDHNNLLEAAKNGDEDTMEALTIEDIGLYSQVSKRMIEEDIYSIIDTCFLPRRIECDQYSVIGDILHIDVFENRIIEEEIYDFTLDCNDTIFHTAINKKDLVDEPKVGRRFKGQI